MFSHRAVPEQMWRWMPGLVAVLAVVAIGVPAQAAPGIDEARPSSQAMDDGLLHRSLQQTSDECTNGEDDDEDGQTDADDENCEDPQDSERFPDCFDDLDNDGDGRTDFSGDPDEGDPDCEDEDDETEEGDEPEPEPVTPGNGDSDSGGPGPDNGKKDKKSKVPPGAECANGADDDDDGPSDFPADRGCASASDDDETDVPGDVSIDLTDSPDPQFLLLAPAAASAGSRSVENLESEVGDYSMLVRNPGPGTLRNVRVTVAHPQFGSTARGGFAFEGFTAPSGVTCTAPRPGSSTSGSGDLLRCSVDQLAPGRDLALGFRGRMTVPARTPSVTGEFSARVDVTAGNAGNDPANDSDTESTQAVAPTPGAHDLSLALSTPKAAQYLDEVPLGNTAGSRGAGEGLQSELGEYRAVVHNEGPGSARFVRFDVPYPAVGPGRPGEGYIFTLDGFSAPSGVACTAPKPSTSDVSDAVLTCSMTELAPGREVVVSFRGRLRAPARAKIATGDVSAAVASGVDAKGVGRPDLNPANNRARVQVSSAATPSGPYDLAVGLSAPSELLLGPKPFSNTTAQGQEPGVQSETGGYEFAVENTGPGTARSVAVSVPVPTVGPAGRSGFALEGIVAPPGVACQGAPRQTGSNRDGASHVVRCEIETLAPGRSFTVRFSGRLTSFAAAGSLVGSFEARAVSRSDTGAVVSDLDATNDVARGRVSAAAP